MTVELQLLGKRKWHTVWKQEYPDLISDVGRDYIALGVSIPERCLRCHRKIERRYARMKYTRQEGVLVQRT